MLKLVELRDASRDAHIDAATAEALRLFGERIEAQYEVLELILFGSRARGEQRLDSDADLAVLLAGEHACRVDVALQLADIAFDVMLDTGVLIDAIPVWQDEWMHPERFSNPALIEHIRYEGLPL